MSGTYDVKVKVISQKGTCHAGHQEGARFVIQNHTPAGICLYAYNSLAPIITTLRHGGQFAWSDDPTTCRIACPDGDNPVVFELSRGAVQD